MEQQSGSPYQQILVALDGSADSLAGGSLALALAGKSGASVRAVHVYDAKIHNSRFREMEPGLPDRFRTGESLERLRREHDSLMNEGFRALSLGYMEDFLRQAGEMGIAADETAVAGRNYIGILDLLHRQKFDLAVLGATGLGAQGDDELGSTALRVLRRAPCDILIARSAVTESGTGSVTACIDGSGNAAAAARKAAALASRLGWNLHLLAAYDVAFHRTIFNTMARSLSAARQNKIGLERQEAVHEVLIDKSLEVLYGSFLQAAAKDIEQSIRPAATHLRPGKAYRAIIEYAGEQKNSLIVLGRYGHNFEEISDIGSHAEQVARTAPCHVLVTGGRPAGGTPSVQEERHGIDWDEEALLVLEKIPAAVRPMAKKFIERQAMAEGKKRITPAVCRQAAGGFSMG